MARAIKNKKITIKSYNPRVCVGWAKKYNPTDDRPFGGGPGMVMRAEPILKAVAAVKLKAKSYKLKVMRELGIDYGKKRVGIALSDESGKFALPKAVLPASPTLASEIEKIAKTSGVKTIVIGESRDYGGRANPLIQDINVLVRILKDKGFDVIFEPEYGSSYEAERFQGKGENNDASAAAIILQRYLEKQPQ